MRKILCFVSEAMADFEVTLAFHKLKTIGHREVVTVGYDLNPIISESGLTYLPNQTLEQALDLPDVEGLIIPGGPIRAQGSDLTALIQQLHQARKLLAAICNGPQYLGRAGIFDQHHYTTSFSQEKMKLLPKPHPFPHATYRDERVVQDGHVITAKGRAFVDFSFAIFDYLGVYVGRQDEQDRLYNDIMDRQLVQKVR